MMETNQLGLIGFNLLVIACALIWLAVMAHYAVHELRAIRKNNDNKPF